MPNALHIADSVRRNVSGYQIQLELEYSCLMTGYQQIGAENIIEIREIRAPTVRHESNAVALHKTHFDAEDRSHPSGLTVCYEFSFKGLAFRNGSRHQVAAEPVGLLQLISALMSFLEAGNWQFVLLCMKNSMNPFSCDLWS